MRTVLGIPPCWAVVLPAFGLFYIGYRVLRIDGPQLQTMMYLLLSVAGLPPPPRTRGPWWARCGFSCWRSSETQTVVTLICVFGFLATPLWWGWAALVWATPRPFLVTDPIKLLLPIDATKKPTAKRQGQSRAESDAVKPDGAKPKWAEVKTANRSRMQLPDGKPH